ncbi:MAG TPA: hypothetical protein VFE36_06130 [Candidatus Baltobacteraceae bacterium]|jgi:hypothetical protein|nr:hypothetical protein [Candidatus Baltobacteraceae bacterium]
MTDRELIAAARHALANVENEQVLLRSSLLPRDHRLSYGTLRFIVLNALQSLAPTSAGPSAQRQRRPYTILVRCDLNGEVHKSVIKSLAVSRRQFYRERHEALLRLASIVRQHVKKAQAQAQPVPSSTTMVDLGDAAEAYVEALRAAGQHRLVWEEASALARRNPGDSREIEFLLVASEAARFLGDSAGAQKALDVCLATSGDSFWRSLWIASSAMSLQWVDGESTTARSTFERAVTAGPDERTLHGKEAILLGIMLSGAARLEIDCGRWDRARSLIARASNLLQNGASAKPQSLSRLSALIFRISSQLALHADGDRQRSILSFRAALDAARASGELGSVAETAIRFAAALGPDDPHTALSYADYGLEIGRRFYPGDRLSELTVTALPLLLRERGAEAAEHALFNARRPGLGVRDTLFLQLADAKIAAHLGDFRVALERAEDTSASLFRLGIDAWACDAQLIALEACERLGLHSRAKRSLSAVGDVLARATAETRARARRLQMPDAPNVLLPT